MFGDWRSPAVEPTQSSCLWCFHTQSQHCRDCLLALQNIRVGGLPDDIGAPDAENVVLELKSDSQLSPECSVGLLDIRRCTGKQGAKAAGRGDQRGSLPLDHCEVVRLSALRRVREGKID